MSNFPYGCVSWSLTLVWDADTKGHVVYCSEKTLPDKLPGMPKTGRRFFAYPIKKADTVLGCGGCHPDKGSGSYTDSALPPRG